MQFDSVQCIQEKNRNLVCFHSDLFSHNFDDQFHIQHCSLEGTAEEILQHRDIINHMKQNRSCRRKL